MAAAMFQGRFLVKLPAKKRYSSLPKHLKNNMQAPLSLLFVPTWLSLFARALHNITMKFNTKKFYFSLE